MILISNPNYLTKVYDSIHRIRLTICPLLIRKQQYQLIIPRILEGSPMYILEWFRIEPGRVRDPPAGGRSSHTPQGLSPPFQLSQGSADPSLTECLSKFSFDDHQCRITYAVYFNLQMYHDYLYCTEGKKLGMVLWMMYSWPDSLSMRTEF